MPKLRDWSLPAKVITAAACSLLISFGLCGFLGTWDSVGATRLSEAAVAVGSGFFWLSILLFFLWMALLAFGGRKDQ